MATKKRFLSWQLTGKGKIVGVLPIPDGQEPDDYTELELDKELVVGINEYFLGYPTPLVRKPTYDAKKRLQHSDYTDPTNGHSGRNMYEFDARGMLCARQEIDAKGKLRFRIEVQCDDQGRFLDEKIHDHSGRLEERHTYEYDAQGNLTKDVKYGSDGKTVVGYYTQTHDEQGRILSHGYHAPDGQERNLFSYQWDALNRRTEIALGPKGKPSVITRFSYDAKGKRTSVEHLDGSGATLSQDTRGADGQMHSWVPAHGELGPRTTALAQGKSIKDVINMTAEQLTALGTVAYSHFEQGRFEQARSLWESLCSLDAKDPAYPAGVAVCLLSQEDPQSALLWYERALGRQATHLPSLVGKGEVHLQLGEIDKALEMFKEAFALAPSKNDPAVRRARVIVTAISQAGRK